MLDEEGAVGVRKKLRKELLGGEGDVGMRRKLRKELLR